jgi:hypothetical protein
VTLHPNRRGRKKDRVTIFYSDKEQKRRLAAEQSKKEDVQDHKAYEDGLM